MTFFNEKTSANRVLGGGVTPDAGLVPALNDIVQQFMALPASDKAGRKAILGDLESAVRNDVNVHPNHREFGMFYTMAMRNMVDGKLDFPQKEYDRLKRVIASTGLNAKAHAVMQKRMNIMKQFIVPSPADAPAGADREEL